jgi:glutathione S-transferase
MLFAIEAGIALDYVRVDLFAGEHKAPPFMAVNPNGAVPVLEDGGFVLSESSAILKYLADLHGHAAYPKELKARARVNELMDWFNTGLMRDFCYGLVYHQLLPHYRIPEPGHSQRLAMHQGLAERRLCVLDGLIDGRPFVCGEDITLADYLGAGFMSAAELIGFDFSRWPHVDAWMKRMTQRPAWFEANAGLYGWKSAIAAQLKLSA